jgi:hypothetical protein
MDMDDLIIFKFLRQTIVANIAQHNALKVLVSVNTTLSLNRPSKQL